MIMTEINELTVEEGIKLRKTNPDANKLFDIIESMADSISVATTRLEEADKKYSKALEIARKILVESNN